jgi:hypothetical protein
MEPVSEKTPVERSERVMSHALVELRRHNWWPFGVKSAVLLDMSATGFKIELTGPAVIKLESIHILTIPLRPFGIPTPPSIQISVRVKWFQKDKMRIGGTFEVVQPRDFLFLNSIISYVKYQPIS